MLLHTNFTWISHANSQWIGTVPFKCKLTVSTRNSILDTRCFRESRIEFRGSSFEFRVSSIEFRVSRRSKNFSRKRFISRIRNNRINQYRASCGFLYSCKGTHIYLILTSESLVWSWSLESQYKHSLRRKNNTRTSHQPNWNVCQCEIIFLALTNSSELKFELARRMQIYHVLLWLYELANVK